MKSDHRNILVERRLKLPNKEQEIELFLNYDLINVFDRYLPLADYLMDEYACPNDDVRMIVEETVYNALLATVIKFRRIKRYEKETTFTTFFSCLVRDILDDIAKGGKIYKISKMQIAK